MGVGGLTTVVRCRLLKGSSRLLSESIEERRFSGRVGDAILTVVLKKRCFRNSGLGRCRVDKTRVNPGRSSRSRFGEI